MAFFSNKNKKQISLSSGIQGAFYPIDNGTRISLLIAQRDLSIALSAVSDLHDAFTLCINTILQISRMDAAAIYRVNADTGLSLFAHKGISDISAIKMVDSPREKDAVRNISAGHPVYYSAYSSETSRFFDESLLIEGFRSGTAIPIMYKDRVMYALYLFSRRFGEVPSETQSAVASTISYVGGAVARMQETTDTRRSLATSKDWDRCFLIDNRTLALVFGATLQNVDGRSLVKISDLKVDGKNQRTFRDRLNENKSINVIEGTLNNRFDKILLPVGETKGGIYPSTSLDRKTEEPERSDEAIRENEETFKILMDIMDIGYAVVDAQWKILNSNREYVRLTGRDNPEELKGQSVIEWTAELDRERSILEMRDCVEKRFKSNFEVDYVDPAGNIVPVEIHAAAVNTKEGIHLIILARNISQQKQAEKNLRQSEERYRILAENSLTGILVLLDNKVAYANRYCARDLGYSVDEMIGQPIWNFIASQDREKVRSSIEAVLGGQQVLTRSGLRLLSKQGEMRWVEIISSLIVHNDRPAILANVLDITEHKQALEELEEAKNAAEAASRTKSEFLANMSHELKTPLNAVIGFSELLEDPFSGSLNEEQKDYVSTINESSRHLLKLISSILDLAKIESGEMNLKMCTFKFVDLLKNSVDFIRLGALKRSLSLELEIDSEVEALTITADELKLKQVLLNLLSNAVKFTPKEGNIKIRARVSEDDLEVSIADNGLGIKACDLSRIFRAFEQVDSSFSRQYQGTGLGLSLSRRLIEMHGGRIWVESEGIGNGSTFKFSIPLKTP